MIGPAKISSEEARRIGDSLGINWRQVDLEQFRTGLLMELEYVSGGREASEDGRELSLTGRIALAHLREHPNYYTRIAAMESAAEERQEGRWRYAP